MRSEVLNFGTRERQNQSVFNLPVAVDGSPIVEVARAAQFVHRRFAMPRRQTAQTAQPLSPGGRKALVAEIAKTASPKVRRGLKLIDFREPTERERAHAETLGALARRALARGAKQAV